MTTFETCGLCGNRAEQVHERIDFPVGKRLVTVDSQHFRCASCGETFFSPEQLTTTQQAASAEVRRLDGLLAPDEIRNIRLQYGLTQTQLETLIGAGPKTVVRWERGTVFQNKATDALLRVIREVPEAFAFLAARNKVDCAVRVSPLFAPLGDPVGHSFRMLINEVLATAASTAAAGTYWYEPSGHRRPPTRPVAAPRASKSDRLVELRENVEQPLYPAEALT